MHMRIWNCENLMYYQWHMNDLKNSCKKNSEKKKPNKHDLLLNYYILNLLLKAGKRKDITHGVMKITSTSKASLLRGYRTICSDNVVPVLL